MDCLLTPWALFEIFAVAALSDEMGSKSTYLNSLTTLIADGQHWASVEIMHIFIVFLYKSFIGSLAELTNLFFIYKIGGCFFWNIDELISDLELHLRLGLPSALRRSF